MTIFVALVRNLSTSSRAPRRCSIGDNSLLGDGRWAGLYGIDADFVAEENSKAVILLASDFQAIAPQCVALRCNRGRIPLHHHGGGFISLRRSLFGGRQQQPSDSEYDPLI